MSPPCLQAQGCHLIPLCYLFTCSSAQSCYSFCHIFFCLLVHSSELFKKNSATFFDKRQFFCVCVAPVQQLGEVSLSVVCAACSHMALVFAVMYLNSNLSFFFIASIHSFKKKNLKKKYVIDKSTKWSTPACPSLIIIFF